MPPLVLIGGTLCDRQLWAPLLEGWAVDAVTLTAGDPPCAGPLTMADYAEALLGTLPPRATLIGFSLGGLIALELVARAPERFDRLALVCAGAGPEAPGGAAARRAGEDAAEARGMAAHMRDDLIPRYGLADPDAVAPSLVAMAERLGLPAYRRQNDLAISRADSRPRLHRIGMPVLLLSGADDPLCPPSRHAEIDGAFPDVHRETVAKSGHMLPLEAPGALRRHIADLRARPARD